MKVEWDYVLVAELVWGGGKAYVLAYSGEKRYVAVTFSSFPISEIQSFQLFEDLWNVQYCVYVKVN